MSTTTDEGQRVAMYRVGHRVPCHVYRAGVPLFTAATDDLARTVASEGNAGIGAIESTAALVQEVERLRAVCAERQSRIDALELDAAKRVQTVTLKVDATEARNAIRAAADRLTGRNLALDLVEADDEFTHRCIACNEVVQEGQLVLEEAEGGLIHKACCGSGREDYTGADGEPLKPGEEIPAGWPYQKDPKAPGAGFVVATAREGVNQLFRAWGQTGPYWTADRRAALHFARRVDAECFAAEDEDAWRIIGSGVLPEPIDNESLDATDGAHPAWWRGNDAGCMAVVRMVEEALSGARVLGEPGEPRLGAILRQVGQLRAYLRAFVRVCYDERVTRGKEAAEAARAAGLFRVNPSMTFNFALNDTDMRDVPLITGGQVLRAMELLGEVPELTPAEEAKNLVAGAVLRNVQWYVGEAARRVAAMPEEDREKHDLLGLNVHLQNMVQAIAAAAPGSATPIDVQIADALQEVRTFVEAMNATDMTPTDTYVVCLSFMDEQTASEALTAGTLRAIVRLADLIVPPAGEAQAHV